MKKNLLASLLFLFVVGSSECLGINYVTVEDGIIVNVPEGKMRLRVYSDRIVRVTVSPVDTFSTRPSLILSDKVEPSSAFKVSEAGDTIEVKTNELIAQVCPVSGSVRFLDKNRELVLCERSRNGRKMTEAVVGGEKTWNVRQQWESPRDEVILGLGHHQNDRFNLRGVDIDLWQENWEIVVPFFTSSRGYGILWDNYSHSRFGFPVTQDFIPCDRLYDKEGVQGALTGSYYDGPDFDALKVVRRDSVVNFDFKTFGPQQDNSFTTDPDWVSKPLSREINPENYTVRWEGEVKTLHAGKYTFNTFTTHNVRLWVDDTLIVDGYGSSNLYLKGDIELKADTRYKIKYEWQRSVDDPIHEKGNGAVQLRWSPPAQERYDGINMWSEVGDGIDYYFIYGPHLDKVIDGYRTLTGVTPLLPQWAYGYWHSHINIQSQKEYLDLIGEFRSRKIPLDVLVQDLNYWVPYPWGSHKFDENRYPDPAAMIEQAHEAHIRYIISVWGMFQKGSDNWKELLDKGLLFRYNNCSFWTDKGTWYYNPFDPKGREVYWSQMNRDLFRKGVDGWWLDASEPEISTPADPFLYKEVMNNNLGTGARYLNTFSLMQTKGIYEGQREAAPDKRVVILARSAFAGQQSYATVMWTGDIAGTWDVFRRQIKCGLNFAMSGLPYWTTDIGGFFINSTDWPLLNQDPGYRELYTRWFQWGTFCPVMRTHGCGPRREMWIMGDESYRIQKRYDELRYTLSPYIYSLAGKVTLDNYTLMRPLLMDFRGDRRVHEIYDQYMFGPALMVCPVLEAGITSREVYLPAGNDWYDYWTNERFVGGQSINRDTPIDNIPVLVRSGSIIPSGEVMQYTGEKKPEHLLITVYVGADGDFTLYEDEGDNYNYESGAFSLIPINWDQASRTLTIASRKGEFPGMLKQRRFTIRFVDGEKLSSHEVEYTGDTIRIRQ
ncbi:TIM-barrel domain-containing protein [uncultured Parabacteroides sp.]|uniref:TIM-barrel domain-containing protein n=1 Tax=uncultured Parabacteroides sp. TaxID=512312 RepID=UPI002611525F|nr:TIM-barrel domain-containing protein [uncultured Parabacteroides sp.]